MAGMGLFGVYKNMAFDIIEAWDRLIDGESRNWSQLFSWPSSPHNSSSIPQDEGFPSPVRDRLGLYGRVLFLRSFVPSSLRFFYAFGNTGFLSV